MKAVTQNLILTEKDADFNDLELKHTITDINKQVNSFEIGLVTLVEIIEDDMQISVEFNNVKISDTLNLIPCVVKDRKNLNESFEELFFNKDGEFSQYVKPAHALELLKSNNLDFNNIILLDGSSYVAYDMNLTPISLAIKFGEMDSISENYYKDETYQEIVSHLKQHPYTINLKETGVFHMNERFSNQQAIEWVVQLPQDVFLKLWKASLKEDYPFCLVKDTISGKYPPLIDSETDREIDVFGINSLMAKWREKYFE